MPGDLGEQMQDLKEQLKEQLGDQRGIIREAVSKLTKPQDARVTMPVMQPTSSNFLRMTARPRPARSIR